MSDAARQLAAQPGNFDPSAIAKDIDLTNPQSGADQVRNNPWQGAGTPFGAVQMGYNELVSHEDTDSSHTILSDCIVRWWFYGRCDKSDYD